jgi:hypothetical protein
MQRLLRFEASGMLRLVAGMDSGRVSSSGESPPSRIAIAADVNRSSAVAASPEWRGPQEQEDGDTNMLMHIRCRSGCNIGYHGRYSSWRTSLHFTSTSAPHMPPHSRSCFPLHAIQGSSGSQFSPISGLNFPSRHTDVSRKQCTVRAGDLAVRVASVATFGP